MQKPIIYIYSILGQLILFYEIRLELVQTWNYFVNKKEWIKFREKAEKVKYLRRYTCWESVRVKSIDIGKAIEIFLKKKKEKKQETKKKKFKLIGNKDIEIVKIEIIDWMNIGGNDSVVPKISLDNLPTIRSFLSQFFFFIFFLSF